MSVPEAFPVPAGLGAWLEDLRDASRSPMDGIRTQFALPCLLRGPTRIEMGIVVRNDGYRPSLHSPISISRMTTLEMWRLYGGRVETVWSHLPDRPDYRTLSITCATSSTWLS